MLDRLQVEFLAERLRNDALAVRDDDERLAEQLLQLLAVAAGKCLDDPGEIRCAQYDSLTARLIEVTEEGLGTGDGIGRAVDFQPLLARHELHAD